MNENYNLSPMFLSNYRKQTAKLQETIVPNGRNNRVGVNFHPKNIHFYGFLNRKLKKSQHGGKGNKDHQNITCYDE